MRCCCWAAWSTGSTGLSDPVPPRYRQGVLAASLWLSLVAAVVGSYRLISPFSELTDTVVVAWRDGPESPWRSAASARLQVQVEDTMRWLELDRSDTGPLTQLRLSPTRYKNMWIHLERVQLLDGEGALRKELVFATHDPSWHLSGCVSDHPGRLYTFAAAPAIVTPSFSPTAAGRIRLRMRARPSNRVSWWHWVLGDY